MLLSCQCVPTNMLLLSLRWSLLVSSSVQYCALPQNDLPHIVTTSLAVLLSSSSVLIPFPQYFLSTPEALLNPADLWLSLAILLAEYAVGKKRPFTYTLCLSSGMVSILALKLKIRPVLSQGSPLWCQLRKIRRIGRRSVCRASSCASPLYRCKCCPGEQSCFSQASCPACPSDKEQVAGALAPVPSFQCAVLLNSHQNIRKGVRWFCILLTSR